MKKMGMWILCVGLIIAGVACSKQEQPFQIESIDVAGIEEKMKDKEDFLFVVIRDNCPYCKEMEEYLEESKEEHPGYTLYQLDATDFELYKESEEATFLSAKSEEGKTFLQMAPSFFYTPSFFAVQKGKIQSSAVGFEPDTLKVNVWERLDRAVDFDQAEKEDVWDYIESYAQRKGEE